MHFIAAWTSAAITRLNYKMRSSLIKLSASVPNTIGRVELGAFTAIIIHVHIHITADIVASFQGIHHDGAQAQDVIFASFALFLLLSVLYAIYAASLPSFSVDKKERKVERKTTLAKSGKVWCPVICFNPAFNVIGDLAMDALPLVDQLMDFLQAQTQDKVALKQLRPLWDIAVSLPRGPWARVAKKKKQRSSIEASGFLLFHGQLLHLWLQIDHAAASNVDTPEDGATFFQGCKSLVIRAYSHAYASHTQVGMCAVTIRESLIWCNDQISAFLYPAAIKQPAAPPSPFSAESLQPTLHRLSSYLSSPTNSPRHWSATISSLKAEFPKQPDAAPIAGIEQQSSYSSLQQGQYPSRLLHDAAVAALHDESIQRWQAMQRTLSEQEEVQWGRELQQRGFFGDIPMQIRAALTGFRGLTSNVDLDKRAEAAYPDYNHPVAALSTSLMVGNSSCCQLSLPEGPPRMPIVVSKALRCFDSPSPFFHCRMPSTLPPKSRLLMEGRILALCLVKPNSIRGLMLFQAASTEPGYVASMLSSCDLKTGREAVVGHCYVLGTCKGRIMRSSVCVCHRNSSGVLCFLPPILKALAMEAASNPAWLQPLFGHQSHALECLHAKLIWEQAGIAGVFGQGCSSIAVLVADLAIGAILHPWRAFPRHRQCSALCQFQCAAGAVLGRPPDNRCGAQRTDCCM
eukprot:1158288-Pelagomonas_calceolata.AAC.2